jgi:imidazole glycerol-phosphate synthase subunit HisF
MKKKLRIIPKIDVKGMNVVKGIHFEGLRALGDPIEYSKFYYNNHADEIIYHDIVASLYERNSLNKLISNVSKNIFIPFTVGGGLRNVNDVKNVLKSGADRVFINTAAIHNPNIINEIVNDFGASSLIISIEVNKHQDKYKCYTDFGREESDIDLFNWINEIEKRGAREIMISSIDRDGTGNGFDVSLSKKITQITNMSFIIGGGFGEISHIHELLDESNPSGVFISSSLHYNNVHKINKNKINVTGNFEFLKKKEKMIRFKKIPIQLIKKSVT